MSATLIEKPCQFVWLCRRRGVPQAIGFNSYVIGRATCSTLENSMFDEMTMPLSSGDSCRDPQRTQIPAVTDRQTGHVLGEHGDAIGKFC